MAAKERARKIYYRYEYEGKSLIFLYSYSTGVNFQVRRDFSRIEACGLNLPAGHGFEIEKKYMAGSLYAGYVQHLLDILLPRL